jgi:chemotaxis protein methyltransferase CheR
MTHDELEELLELVYTVHGYDFRGYARASMNRRVHHLMSKKSLNAFELRLKLLNDEPFFQDFLNGILVNVTEMFRDPSFYKAVKDEVFPYLESYSHIRVWNAGCATGEETYSFAIFLKEAGLMERSFLYGTDISPVALQKASDGIYDLKRIKGYSVNYLDAGGKTSLSDYYHSQYDAAIMHGDWKKNMMYSVHNLVTDKPFNEFQVVVCRNVLIYFDTELQNHVLNLLYNSLAPLGFLCLGSKETIHDRELLGKLKVVNRKENIYQKRD